MNGTQLDFTDTQNAFGDISTNELKEKYRLFKMMNSPLLNAVGTTSAKFALSLGLPVEGIIKRTVFTHFCGGETIEECGPTVEKLNKHGIGAVLDYSVEGKTNEKEFDAAKDEFKKTVSRSAGDPGLPFSVFKVTAIAPFGTLQRLSSGEEIPAKSVHKIAPIRERIDEICKLGYELDQSIFIDAEESWIQDAIDQFAADMMEQYNRDRPIIYNTVQLYRKDRLDFLKRSHRLARENGYILGVKLVRGAYMEKERDRASEMGYESPIQPDKSSSDKDYDLALEYCLENIDTISVVAATHNESSTKYLAKLMLDKGLPNDHPHVYFSQLYGMSDNISLVLAKNGYNVSKYLPYGPVKETLPYLIRRANENTSVAGQVSRELELLERELGRRGK